MWAMTPFGILMPAIRPPKTVKFGDPQTMQVRARRARDLDILRAVYMPGQLGPTIHTPDMDYEYRAYCVPAAFAMAMAQMVMDIDYLKFKPQTDKFADDELHGCYNAIWTVVLNRLSDKKPVYDGWHGAKPYSPKKALGPVTSTTATSTSSSNRPVDDFGGALDGWDEYFAARYGGLDHDDEVTVVSSGNAHIDDLYARIDVLTEQNDSAKPASHGMCSHAPTPNARARCRRRRRRETNARLDDLYREIDEYYANKPPTTTTSAAVTAGESATSAK